MSKFDVITIGGATEDLTFYTSEGVLINNKKDVLHPRLLAFKYGAKIKIDKSHSTFGGGAANAAVCLSRLGLRVASFVCLGDDYRGSAVLDNFKKFKVETGLIQRKKGQTGFSFLLVGPGNEHIVFSDRAANSQLGVSIRELRELKKANWVYMTSLSGKWEQVLEKVFSAKSPKIAWNPGHIQLKSGYQKIGKYLKKTNVLFLNKDEAIELAISKKENKKKTARFLNNVKNLLNIIKSWGPETVVITSGRDGADAFDGRAYYHQNILKEKRKIDTTGVGDAFGSSFIAGLQYFEKDIKKSMLLGVKNTASVIAKQGAQNGLLTKKQILK